ncbi:MAG: YihY/virulence factor BrkB family protein, partial [Clostridia bacterium]|nr:YihY/virulence factor BrkB family protein [Clostridia bacterium]
QMRRSGEFIYDYHPEKRGLILRFGALILLLIVMVTAVLFAVTFALGSFVFSRIFPRRVELLADYILLASVSFFLVLLLNMYICPFKTKAKYFLSGTALTVFFWIVAVVGFSVYLKISNMDKLYGALSALIVFLLWLYVLMICFIVGVIFNSEKVLEVSRKNKKKRKKTY